MTTSPPASAQRRAPLGLVGTTVSEHITVLQNGYLNDRSDAVATLARLRRGIGKPANATPELWGLTGTEPLYTRHDDGALSEQQILRAEGAAHAALTLWALHQQSQRPHRMHVPGGLELGAAVRRLMPGPDLDEPTRKRFVRAGTASSLTILAQRLRELVLLLRGEAIPLDYGLLAQQLYRWQQPGGPEQVRRSWGRSFHASRTPTAAEGETPDINSTTTHPEEAQ